MRAGRLMSRRDDRGAVLIIFAVFAVVAVLLLAAVVDLGGLRQEKKEVTLSTDAAALAGVSLANMADPSLSTIHSLQPCASVSVDPVLTANGKNPQGFTTVQAVVDDYLARNGDSNPVDCRIARSGVNQGYVVVSANEVVPYNFSEAVGQASGQVGGMSVAARASGLGGGLRPVGICATEQSLNEKSAGASYTVQNDVLGVGALDARGVNVLGSPVTLVLEKEHLKKSVNACSTGDASGQRGQVNFDGKNGNGGQKCDDPSQPPDSDQSYVESFRDGYHGQINSYVERDAGNDFNTATPCMDDLIASNQRVWLPVYDDYDKSRKSYKVIAFIEVELEGYCLGTNGQNYNDGGGSTPCTYTGLDAEWFRLKIYGSFTPASFPAAPPLTADARASQSFICAYEDGSSILQNQCTSVVGAVSGPPAEPQPQAVCDVTDAKIRLAASAPGSGGASLEVSKSSPDGTLSVAVAIDLTVAVPADCVDVKFSLKQHGAGPSAVTNEIQTVTPTNNTFAITESAGEPTYTKSTRYDLIATDAEGGVTVPAVSLRVRN